MWCKGFDCIQYYFVEPEQEEEEEDTDATKSKGRKGKAGKSGPTKGTSGRKGKSGGASAAEGPQEEKGTVLPDMILPVSMSAIIPNIWSPCNLYYSIRQKYGATRTTVILNVSIKPNYMEFQESLPL